MRILSFLLLFLALAFSCQPERKNGILSEKEMEDVMVDYHLAQGMAMSMDEKVEENRYLFIQAVFRKHNITEAEFDSSLVYYTRHSETFQEIYKRVVERVRTEAETNGVSTDVVHDQFANLTNQGDTANIWTDVDHVMLLPDKLHNLYQFHLKADTTFHKGDVFIWRFNTEFFSSTYSNEAYAHLYLVYDNDSTVCSTLPINVSSLYNLRYEPSAPLDTMDLVSIHGFVYVPIRKGVGDTRITSLHDISLIRMHVQKAVEEQQASDADSIPGDTLRVDSVALDSSSASAAKVRLKPSELREQQPREHRIRVVKEQPVNPNLKPGYSQRRIR